MKKRKLDRSTGRREVIGWKTKPKAWFPEIGLFDTQSQREAKKREQEKAKADEQVI